VLGLDVAYDYTPRMMEKISHAGAHASFGRASDDLNVLAECAVSEERVRRLTERVGQERVIERDAAAETFATLPFPARRESPVEQEQTPEAVSVQMDGGRLQCRDRHASGKREAGFWKEFKAGDLRVIVSQPSAEDPCPQLPASFADPERMSQLAREIKGFSSAAPDTTTTPKTPAETPAEPESQRPRSEALSVVATTRDVHQFGLLLAAAAHARGFNAAQRKAFIGDGSETNWTVWRDHFSHYTPIVDFVHAVAYVYAAAMAGRDASMGWATHLEWAQWLWSGQIERLIAAVEARQREVGLPEAHETENSPRSQIAKTLGYLRNQQSRMHYDQYRRQGLPITSSPVESTIKRVARRMKGTEKFWSVGAEAMLTLVADHLSETTPLKHYWATRRPPARRSYQTAT